ncbi:hypothetical protein ACFVHQ_20215 [Actinomycetes bacterium NPDC127524]
MPEQNIDLKPLVKEIKLAALTAARHE